MSDVSLYVSDDTDELCRFETLPSSKMLHDVHIAEARSRILETISAKCDYKTYLLACTKANINEITERLPEVVDSITIGFTVEDLLLEECNDIQLQQSITIDDVEYCLDVCERVIRSTYETINSILKLKVPESIRLEHIHIVNELSKPYVSHSTVNIIAHVQDICDQSADLIKHLVSAFNSLYADMLEKLSANDWLDNPSRYVSEFVEPLDMLTLYINVLAHVIVVFGIEQGTPLVHYRMELLGIWFCIHSVIADLNTLSPNDRYVVYIPKVYYNSAIPLYKQIDEYTK